MLWGLQACGDRPHFPGSRQEAPRGPGRDEWPRDKRRGLRSQNWEGSEDAEVPRGTDLSKVTSSAGVWARTAACAPTDGHLRAKQRTSGPTPFLLRIPRGSVSPATSDAAPPTGQTTAQRGCVHSTLTALYPWAVTTCTRQKELRHAAVTNKPDVLAASNSNGCFLSLAGRPQWVPPHEVLSVGDTGCWRPPGRKSPVTSGERNMAADVRHLCSLPMGQASLMTTPQLRDLGKAVLPPSVCKSPSDFPLWLLLLSPSA